MNEVRKAIKTKLATNATLLALLGNGAASIVSEFNATNSLARPFIVIRYDGSSGRFHLAAQVWAIQCHIDPKRDTWYKSSAILKQVKSTIDYQWLDINDDAAGCCECNWYMDIPTYHDTLFGTDVEGHRYRVYVIDA